MASYKVGILGATGAVGEQMRIVLAELMFPISELRLFGSARSAGKVINYEGQDIVVQEASLEAFKGLTSCSAPPTIPSPSSSCPKPRRWASTSWTTPAPSALIPMFRSSSPK